MNYFFIKIKLDKKTVESNFPICGMIPQNDEKSGNNSTFLNLKENNSITNKISENNLTNFYYKPSKRESNYQRKNALKNFQNIIEIEKNMLFYNLSTKSNSLGTNKNINSPIRKNSNFASENNKEISKSEVGYNLAKNNLSLNTSKDEVEEKISLKTFADSIINDDFFDNIAKNYGAKNSSGNIRSSNASKSKNKSFLSSKYKKNLYSIDKSLGLKEISSKVMQIVRRSNSTNYKEISDNIVNDLPNLTSQDSKNIRRRIYDSLNVLKALDILIISDDNKSIVFNKTNCIFDYNDDLKMNIDIKTTDLKAKQVKYNELLEKIEIMKTLVARNKSEEENSNKKKNSEIISKIHYPFIVICTENIEHLDKLEVILSDKGLNKVFISSPSQLALKGDLDIFKQVFQNLK